MSSFDVAVAKVLAHEGGYTPGLPGDPGGETNWGIAKRYHPNLDIKNLTREQAVEIYRSEYWKPEFNTLSQQLADEVMDFAVNAGPVAAHNLLVNPLKIDPAVAVYIVGRMMYYTRLGNFNRFAASWDRRVLDE